MQLQRQWPDDIESVCPQCGKQLNASAHYSIGPGRLGRRVRKIHPWMIAIPVILFPLIMFVWMKAVHSASQASSTVMVFLIVAMLISPVITGSMILFGNSVRRVLCSACGYSASYPLTKNSS